MTLTLKSSAHLTALAVLSLASAASAHDRTALVIANSDYGEHQLKTVPGETAEIAKALERQGFRVTLVENVAAKELKSTVEQFCRTTVTRGTAVIYFAGLGGQYQTYNSKGAWWNHLQGTGKPKDPRNPERESVAVDELLRAINEHSSAAVNLFVLDAARVNPFVELKDQHPLGLAAMDAETLAADTFLHFPREPGTTTGNVSEPSSLAAALVKHLPKASESLGEMLDAIASEAKQRPVQIAGSDPLLRTALPPSKAKALSAESPREGSAPGELWVNSIGMTFCWIPPGKFEMGDASRSRLELADAQPVAVTLSRGFWMARFETTQQECLRAGFKLNPSLAKTKNAPAHNVTQDNTKNFLEGLTKAEQKAGRLPGDWEYSLPTEAEWEYACRAGGHTRFSFGDDEQQLGLYANFADKRLVSDDGALQFAATHLDDGVGKSLATVGSYRPNAWGLFDMHGNVAEWCRDRYVPQLTGGVDPLASDKKANEAVYRGGAWCSTPEYCQAAFRNSEVPNKARDFIGFRLILRKK